MRQSSALLGYADIIEHTDRYLKKHFLLVTILGLTAGLSRFAQESGWGATGPVFYAALDVVVYIAYLLIIFAVIGRGFAWAGVNHFVAVFRLKKPDWSEIGSNIISNIRSNFLAVLVNLIIFVFVAVITNIAIFATLEYTPLLSWLKSADLISQSAGKWPVILLLKNISIIPFTLVFETLFVMWIVESNKSIEE